MHSGCTPLRPISRARFRSRGPSVPPSRAARTRRCARSGPRRPSESCRESRPRSPACAPRGAGAAGGPSPDVSPMAASSRQPLLALVRGRARCATALPSPRVERTRTGGFCGPARVLIGRPATRCGFSARCREHAPRLAGGGRASTSARRPLAGCLGRPDTSGAQNPGAVARERQRRGRGGISAIAVPPLDSSHLTLTEHDDRYFATRDAASLRSPDSIVGGPDHRVFQALRAPRALGSRPGRRTRRAQ